MSEFLFILLGVISAILIALIAYPSQVFIKMRVNKSKINNIYSQIKAQVDIKHSLLKEYIEINKDSINEEKYNIINDKISSYIVNAKSIDTLKDYNNFYANYMNDLEDDLLMHQCKESEEKISHIREYYNELVCFYNTYKSNGVNSILSKVLSIGDEKLY